MKTEERDIVKKHNEWLEAHTEHKKVPWYMWLYCGRDDFIELSLIVIISCVTSIITVVMLQ